MSPEHSLDLRIFRRIFRRNMRENRMRVFPLSFRFRFSLRALIVLTGVVSLLLAACSWHIRKIQSQIASVAAVEECGGRVDYDLTGT